MYLSKKGGQCTIHLSQEELDNVVTVIDNGNFYINELMGLLRSARTPNYLTDVRLFKEISND